MKTNTKVSVIVPVYNAAPYLRQCLDSIIGQTLKEIEIFCVDDGSTDESMDILKEYESKDERITILQQQNSYAGVARNNGMSHAAGKYLMFWDSDDYFQLDALEKLYNACEEHEAEICICSGKRYAEEQEAEVPYAGYLVKKYLPEQPVFQMDDLPDHILNISAEAAWNKMFLHSFIKEKGLQFHPCRNGNDVYFTEMAMCLAERITTVDDVLVVYRRQHGGSLVQTSGKAPLSTMKEWVSLKEDLIKAGRFPEKSYANKILNRVMVELQLSRDFASYRAKVDWLKEEGLEIFGLKEREEGYYYNERYAMLLPFLIKDSPEEFLAKLQYDNYDRVVRKETERLIVKDELRQKNNMVKQLRKELREIKDSRSYKYAQKFSNAAGTFRKK